MPPPPPPTAAQLAELADKYQRLAELRQVRDGDAPATERAVLRELSRRWPGCLRELDTLGVVELQRRALSARAAASGGPAEPWMAWILAFHDLLGRALAAKQTGTASKSPGGRLTPLVLEEVARLFGQPVAEVTAVLFPSRSRGDRG